MPTGLRKSFTGGGSTATVSRDPWKAAVASPRLLGRSEPLLYRFENLAMLCMAMFLMLGEDKFSIYSNIENAATARDENHPFNRMLSANT